MSGPSQYTDEDHAEYARLEARYALIRRAREALARRSHSSAFGAVVPAGVLRDLLDAYERIAPARCSLCVQTCTNACAQVQADQNRST